MESFYWKNLRKTSNESEQPSLKRHVKCAIQSENQQNQHHSSASFTLLVKKVKEALSTRLSGNKITWTETFVRSKKLVKWKTSLNRGTLVCSENLPIKIHFKNNVQSFLRVTKTPLPPKSVSSEVYTAFPQITQKIVITDTCHWLVPITVILGFWKHTVLEKQSLFQNYNFFRKSKVPIFKSNFGWIVCFLSYPSFLHAKTVHVCRLLHMKVDFLQYYSTQESNQMNTGCQSGWNEEGRMCNRSSSIWMEFNNYKLLKRHTLIHPRVWSPNKAFQSNTRVK